MIKSISAGIEPNVQKLILAISRRTRSREAAEKRLNSVLLSSMILSVSKSSELVLNLVFTHETVSPLTIKKSAIPHKIFASDNQASPPDGARNFTRKKAPTATIRGTIIHATDKNLKIAPKRIIAAPLASE